MLPRVYNEPEKEQAIQGMINRMEQQLLKIRLKKLKFLTKLACNSIAG